MNQPLSQLQDELQSIYPYKPEVTPLTPLPSESIPVFVIRNLPLYPHHQHVQLPEEAETSGSEADEDMLQLTLGMEDCVIEYQKKLPVTEAELLSMPFDPHGRIPSTKWPPEKSIGYEAFAKKMARLHSKTKEPAEKPQQQDPDPDRLQTKPVSESPTSAFNRPFSTPQYARKTGAPARGTSRAIRVRVSKTA